MNSVEYIGDSLFISKLSIDEQTFNKNIDNRENGFYEIKTQYDLESIVCSEFVKYFFLKKVPNFISLEITSKLKKRKNDGFKKFWIQRSPFTSDPCVYWSFNGKHPTEKSNFSDIIYVSKFIDDNQVFFVPAEERIRNLMTGYLSIYLVKLLGEDLDISGTWIPIWVKIEEVKED